MRPKIAMFERKNSMAKMNDVYIIWKKIFFLFERTLETQDVVLVSMCVFFMLFQVVTRFRLTTYIVLIYHIYFVVLQYNEFSRKERDFTMSSENKKERLKE